jgi:hypothetical protein
MSGELHDAISLPGGKEPLVKEAGWAQSRSGRCGKEINYGHANWSEVQRLQIWTSVILIRTRSTKYQSYSVLKYKFKRKVVYIFT